jgi:hypothetical protein
MREIIRPGPGIPAWPSRNSIIRPSRSTQSGPAGVRQKRHGKKSRPGRILLIRPSRVEQNQPSRGRSPGPAGLYSHRPSRGKRPSRVGARPGKRPAGAEGGRPSRGTARWPSRSWPAGREPSRGREAGPAGVQGGRGAGRQPD